METRRFGRTGHMSTVAIFGAAALGNVSQEEADRGIQQYIDAGGNHIDVAPSYGEAELRLAPWMPHERQRFFIGCKTMERTRSGADAEMRRSLQRLNIDAFDLYQIHAVTTMDDLDAATRSGGALEAIVAARDAGLTRYIGITGHGMDAPVIFQEALRRFDFDSVLFPINFVLYREPQYKQEAENLLRMCRDRDVGTMIIKSVAREPWGDQPHTFDTWYRPFTRPERIQQGVNFALSQDVTGLCTAGDLEILPLFLDACQNFTPLSAAEQQALIAEQDDYKVIFPAP